MPSANWTSYIKKVSLLITFEGIEGTGKTTQIKKLKDALETQGHSVVLTREPGGTPIGDQIRQIVLDSQNSAIVPECELLLYAAQRAQHVQGLILPALAKGSIVLCDRFTDATTAYQGHGRGFPKELIAQLNQLTAAGANPDLTFLLDCEPEAGLKRANTRIEQTTSGPREDRFERLAIDFHRKVRQGYLEIAQKEPQRVILLDATADVESLHQQILQRVLERLGTKN